MWTGQAGARAAVSGAVCVSQPCTCLGRSSTELLLNTYFDFQMLKHCANFPRALEVLLNVYPCVPSCDTWVEAVLPELWQVHLLGEQGLY